MYILLRCKKQLQYRLSTLVSLYIRPLCTVCGWHGEWRRVDALPNLEVETWSPLRKPHLSHMTIVSPYSLLILTPPRISQLAHGGCGVDWLVSGPLPNPLAATVVSNIEYQFRHNQINLIHLIQFYGYCFVWTIPKTVNYNRLSMQCYNSRQLLCQLCFLSDMTLTLSMLNCISLSEHNWQRSCQKL